MVGRSARPVLREQAEDIIEPRDDLGRLQHANTGGGELDGEGHAIELATDLGDSVCVVAGHRVPVANEPCAYLEQADRVRGSNLDEGVIDRRDRKRRNSEDGFGVHAERLARGAQHPQLGAPRQQYIDDDSSVCMSET